MKHRSRLVVCGIALCTWCIVLSVQSYSFSWDHPLADRPVLTFTTGLLCATGVSLLALREAVHCQTAAHISGIIVGLAIIMRVIMVPSHPIQELDIYRYIWDGLAVTETGNPWQFSPAVVRTAPRDTGLEELQQLTALRDLSGGIRTTLDRIHYAKLTTIYPPVSQGVFAAAAFVTPVQATARTRLIVMRTVITVFDVLTIVAMIRLLRLTGKPVGWSVCYAWSPLVLKEFGNSGHLDAVAVCFYTWAVVCWIDALHRRSFLPLAAGAALLGLATGAKLFPLVVVPVIAFSVWRQMGTRCFVGAALILTTVTVISLCPMFAHRFRESDTKPLSAIVSDSQHPAGRSLQTGEGISEFLQSWKMNHFFFLLIEENIAPTSIAWFAVTPKSTRKVFTSIISDRWRVSSRRAAFFLARAVTMAFFLAIIMRLCRQTWSTGDRKILQASFLSVAWFWLLLPTMNPWYWIWAMPLLPFACQRSWLLLSGCVCIYYLRFWFSNSLGVSHVPGTMYSGRQFFQYVIVWVEYLPWCVVLAAEWWHRRRRKTLFIL